MALNTRKLKKPLKPKNEVILKALPPGLLDNLPPDDQRAIRAVVGKRIALNEYDTDGRAELEFKDKGKTIHFIWVDPKFIEPC